tara:strand:+ start:893 stop:1117 length:225 start_codon:yes stop_codon:yes gene_type:complete
MKFEEQTKEMLSVEISATAELVVLSPAGEDRMFVLLGDTGEPAQISEEAACLLGYVGAEDPHRNPVFKLRLVTA